MPRIKPNPKQAPNIEQKTELEQQILAAYGYNNNDFQLLCKRLEVNHSKLEGDNFENIIANLVKECERKGVYDRLVDLVHSYSSSL